MIDAQIFNRYFLNLSFCGAIVLINCFITKAQALTPISKPKILVEWEKDPDNSPLIDFSYAGYRLGTAMPIRKVPDGTKYFKVTDFGAIPNDEKDDIEAIQKTIDAAGKAGGGVVIFPQGVFDLDVKSCKKFIQIPYSNVILRGYGDGPDGTILFDHCATKYHDESKKWLANRWPSFFKLGTNATDTTDKHPFDELSNQLTQLGNAQRGSIIIPTKNTEKITVGNTYLLVQSVDASNALVQKIVYPLLIKDVSSAHVYRNSGLNQKTQMLVTIIDKGTNSITIDSPLITDLNESFFPTLWQIPNMVSESGIEGFRLKTTWNEEFIHHKNSVHDDGWDAIRVEFTNNCWIRNVRFEGVSAAVFLTNAKNNTVMDCSITGNPGHNGFILGGASTRNLMMRLQGGKQMHTYSLNGFISGNVFTECFSEEPSSIDSHGTLGISNLFDNMHGGVMRNGGSDNVASPLHARGCVLWNWAFGSINPYNSHIVDDICKIKQYPGLIAVGVYSMYNQPIYFVGENGEEVNKDRHDDWAIIEAHGQKVSIISLYEYQHKKRLYTNFPNGK